MNQVIELQPQQIIKAPIMVQEDTPLLESTASSLRPESVIERLKSTDIRRDILDSPEFENYRIAEDIPEGMVSVGLPRNPTQEMNRLWVASQRYAKEGYLNGIDTLDFPEVSPLDLVSGDELNFRKVIGEENFKSFRKKGVVINFKNEMTLYFDPWHFRSIPIYGMMGGQAQGSVRIILPSDSYDLPTFRDGSIQINPEEIDRAITAPVELSQFAITKGAHRGMASALLRSAKIISDKFKVENWIATTDDIVIRVLNGLMYKFEIPKIGPTVDYLGSRSTPIWIDIEKSLSNAERHETSQGTAHFIRGEKIPEGFVEWYRGK